MTDTTLAYASALRRLAKSTRRHGYYVTLDLPPVAAIALAETLERGAMRSRYVGETLTEAEKLHTEAEDKLIRAQDVNEAADRAFARGEAFLRRARWHYATATVAAVLLSTLVMLAGWFS